MEKINWTDRVRNGELLHKVKGEGKESFSMMSACVRKNFVMTSYSHGVLRVISNISLSRLTLPVHVSDRNIWPETSSVMLLFSRYVQGFFCVWGGGGAR